MAEYITREAAIKMIDDYAKTISKDCIVVYQSIRDIVDEICPAADVAEVKHGSWIVIDSDNGMCESYAGFIEFCCSECGLSVGIENGEYDWYYGDPTPWKFCPICGAKMDGKENAE